VSPIKIKISSKKSRPLYIYIYDVKFLALLGAPYIYDISRLRVKDKRPWRRGKMYVARLILMPTQVAVSGGLHDPTTLYSAKGYPEPTE
jgi:hypothetical protein